MKVSAGMLQDYIFEPTYGELIQLNGIYAEILELTNTGYTFKKYRDVPQYLIAGATYFGAVAQKTENFPSKQAALHRLQRGLEIGQGDILNVSQGLIMPNRTIGNSGLGIIADHIPQIYGMYFGKMLASVIGEYDLARKRFIGQCSFIELTDAVWTIR